jgi:hypothetical protein
MTLQFALCLLTLFFLAGIGTPDRLCHHHSAPSSTWRVNGQGVGMAGKVLMDGLYSELHPACRAAVHRRRKHHERRHDLGPAAAASASRWSAASGAGSAMSTSSHR